MENMKKEKIIGIILFVGGVIISIILAAKVEENGNNYPSTFLGAMGLAILGNIIWHRAEKKMVKAQLEEHKNDGNNPLSMLTKTVPAIEQLFEKAQTTQGMDLCYEVDWVLDNHVHPFTDKRKTFMDILGQAKGAEILLDVAYGERMLNRVWSAASDGHHQEALNSIGESLVNYKKAASKLD